MKINSINTNVQYFDKNLNKKYVDNKFTNKKFDSSNISFKASSEFVITEAYPNDDNLKIYLDSIKQYKTIGKKETTELFKKMAEGGADAAKIREKLILANLKLVPFTILKYAKSSVMPVSDLIQEGNIALIKAVDTND